MVLNVMVRLNIAFISREQGQFILLRNAKKIIELKTIPQETNHGCNRLKFRKNIRRNKMKQN